MTDALSQRIGMNRLLLGQTGGARAAVPGALRLRVPEGRAASPPPRNSRNPDKTPNPRNARRGIKMPPQQAVSFDLANGF